MRYSFVIVRYSSFSNFCKCKLYDAVSTMLNILYPPIWTTIFIVLIHNPQAVSKRAIPRTKVPSLDVPPEFSSPMRYVDNKEWDLTFDRLVLIQHYRPNEKKKDVNICPGVMFDRERVLVAYNPFRRYMTNKTVIDNLMLVVATHRHTVNLKVDHYTTENYFINCGRQVIPDPAEKPKDFVWHGLPNEKEFQHSPMHDLMVLRSEYSADFLPQKQDNAEFVKNAEHSSHLGPIRTILANTSDVLGKDLKFASLGITDNQHMVEHRELVVRKYTDSNELVDCDEWFPKSWGHFICIINSLSDEGLASSSMLFHKNKLFGVGSFALWKDGVGIFVFTDVRKYFDVIWKTCSRDDQYLEFLSDKKDGRFDKYE